MDKVININDSIKDYHESKPKSIIIDGQLHNKFKIHCKGKSMKIGGVIEDLIKLYLHDPKSLQKMIDDLKERTIITHRVTGEQIKIEE